MKQRLKSDGYRILGLINDKWEVLTPEWDHVLIAQLSTPNALGTVDRASVILFAREAMLQHVEECLNAVGQEPLKKDELKFVRTHIAKIVS